ncbi:hypothetical protein VitviT2T_005714 [Vitis vinifera]|uniref:Ubiquitin-like protease family profile domain-containing protein n=2 Tax=Vitis vinifera TaxID=29760 RepID=A0ABY9BTP3_VITVI|nr:hypothetical protein VitviT2T_005714 [Vitis vinifera]
MQAYDILVDYVNGLHPIPSMKWFEVDIVYVPINVQSMHWVLGVVYLAQRIILVYDSLIGINSDNRLKVLCVLSGFCAFHWVLVSVEVNLVCILRWNQVKWMEF